jgi:pimeloyl-ACP methyl ester carboxylesterase
VIVLLHGGGDFLNHRIRFPLIARRCNRAGFNAATLEAPYHFQRRSDTPGAWNHLRTTQTFSQAVAEIRALTGWLLGEGCPAVALWGISYGGWQAGLAASRDMRLAAAVLTVPAVRMDFNLSQARWVVWRSVRRYLSGKKGAREALNATPLNLTLTKPAIPKENILLIDGIHELFGERQSMEELWQKWQQPEIWRLPHGHISALFVPGLTHRILRWLGPRLNVPVFQTGQTTNT